jgi:ATPase family protein associated with various cellular activities (AAA)
MNAASPPLAREDIAAPEADGDEAAALGRIHDLEMHIETLRDLDRIRRRSAELRDVGFTALNVLIKKRLRAGGNPFTARTIDACEYVSALRVSWQLSKHRPEANSSRIERLARVVTLDRLNAHDLSTLLATEVLQTLTSVSGLAFSTASLSCWYWILRELYTAAPPDWCIGGARAAPNGWVTGYTTAQCVRALLSFADSLVRAGEFFDEIGRISRRLQQLKYRGIPQEWRAADLQCLAAASRNTLMLLSRGMAVRIDGPKTDRIERFVDRTLPATARRAVGSVLRQLTAAVREVQRFRAREERAGLRRDASSATKSRIIESETGHRIAKAAMERAVDVARSALLDVESRNWVQLALKFRQAAEGVRISLEPSRRYLSTVIDRQLAAAHSGLSREWEPAELASAAVGYCALRTRSDELKDRLYLAAKHLCDGIAGDGTVPNRRPFHTTRSATVGLGNAQVLTIVAELVRLIEYRVETRFAARMLPYFEEMAHFERKADGGRLDGWLPDYVQRPQVPKLSYTGDAVEALAAVNQMLDEGINAIILRYFSIKWPGQIKAGLDDLFYPDYGFALPSVPEPLRHRPVAITLQAMRAHILQRLGPMPDGDRLHSLVLHGPAGTGKTTLVEALARTCRVPLIEVTPSDLAKGGEPAIEQRTRTVFEALSLVTRAVILFDEFDPILRRRETGDGQPFTIFSFLTPGMLPKLKTLNDRAKDRSTAYVLITNLVGTLDEAAIRTGRFDRRIGIYPPDPLSRYGHFMMLCGKQGQRAERLDPHDSRVAEVLARTAGLSMTALMTRGWFKEPGRNDLIGTPLGYVLGQTELTKTWPEPEDELPPGPRGEGRTAEAEYYEWSWLTEWDKKATELSTERSGRNRWPADRLWSWPRQPEGQASAEKLAREMSTKAGAHRRRHDVLE